MDRDETTRQRHVPGLVVPRVGAVRPTGDPVLPWVVVDELGERIDAVNDFLRHLLACGNSPPHAGPTPMNRIEAVTEITNIAEQRALERAGFTREGVLRGATFLGGRWHDAVLYSVLRDEVSLQAPDDLGA